MWQGQIRTWLTVDDLIQDEVVEKLRLEGITISASSLHRRLQDWGISTQPKVQDTPDLRDRIRSLFNQRGGHLTDAETLLVLKQEGFVLNQRQLARMRRMMGLYKHVPRAKWEKEKQVGGVLTADAPTMDAKQTSESNAVRVATNASVTPVRATAVSPQFDTVPSVTNEYTPHTPNMSGAFIDPALSSNGADLQQRGAMASQYISWDSQVPG